MYMLNNGGATANSTVPDICKTPTPAGPMPMPYPNTADTSLADPGGLVMPVLVCGLPAMNFMSKVLLSTGDEPGVGGGVVSGVIMGSMAFIDGSVAVMVGGMPAVRLTSQTAHNGTPPNTTGMVSAPSQTVVMVMS
ncbi:PAAR-like domain-containing protein [Pseudomonas syringae]|uniref:Type VI secretion protein n=1 Tax=Pseudomonas syringae TaxID=317 RepID=A0A085VGE3_PSESX|nr:PAAR-like domain-containing protein [Pseudomonas syringae]KFE54506.1 type VI secretion protein [Pseudomonas syringae]